MVGHECFSFSLANLKQQLEKLQEEYKGLDMEHSTLQVYYNKMSEQYNILKRDLDEAIEKLRLTNRVRNEAEAQFHEEQDKVTQLHEVVRSRDDSILNHKRNIDELERKIGELDRQIQGLELRHQALEKQHEIQLKQQMDKVGNLNEILNTEKETRQSWVERFEKEQK